MENTKLILKDEGVKIFGGRYTSSKFRSLIETVRVSVEVIADDGAELSMTLISYNEEGASETIATVALEKCECGNLCATYMFDPVSLAVYKNSVEFEVIVEAERTQFVLVSFSATEIIPEKREAIKDKLDNTTVMENGEPGVFVTQKDGSRTVVPRIPKKVLVVGNSLVFGMLTSTPFHYGMCASAPDKDYYHYVSTYIKKFNPDCKFDRLYGSYLEHSESMEMFDDWFYNDCKRYVEGTYGAVTKFTPDLDLIILQMGDNTNTDQKEQNYRTAAYVFMERVKELCPKARIIFVHGWYNNGPRTTRSVIIDLCKKWDIERVDTSDLSSDRANAAYGQTEYYSPKDGLMHPVSERWISHPGDLGMKKIADKIIEKLKFE